MGQALMVSWPSNLQHVVLVAKLNVESKGGLHACVCNASDKAPQHLVS